jgi:NhaP-type Na+/H+ or K+/H+ antiporter
MRISQVRLRTLMIAIVVLALALTVIVQGLMLHREAARSAVAADAEIVLRARAEMHLAEARAAMLHAQAADARAKADNGKEKKPAQPDSSAAKP